MSGGFGWEFWYKPYNTKKLTETKCNVNTIQGKTTINAIIIGNKIVQQYDISWSNRILGKDALTHIKTKNITQAFSPKLRLVFNPWIITNNM